MFAMRIASLLASRLRPPADGRGLIAGHPVALRRGPKPGGELVDPAQDIAESVLDVPADTEAVRVSPLTAPPAHGGDRHAEQRGGLDDADQAIARIHGVVLL